MPKEINENDKAFADDLIERMGRHVNNMSLDYDAVAELMVDKMCRTHRTLQASIIRLLLAFIVAYAKRQGAMHTDLRNEDAKGICARLADVIKEHGYIRFI